ncbi:MAG TPA: LuxR C-terminal-related transcriptional regulator [Kofleriaceae bacterium]
MASLRRLLHSIDEATSARALKLAVMDGLAEELGTGATGLYLFGPAGDVTEMHVSGVRDGFVLTYEQLGRDQDPILSRAMETRSIAHDAVVYEADGWTRSELYRACGGPWQIKHYLCAPIVIGSEIVGTINLGRRSEQHPFGRDDVAKIETLRTRIASRLAAFARSDGDDDFGKLRADRTHLRMHVDELEREAVNLDDDRAAAMWESFVDGGVVPVDMFERDDRTYVVLSVEDGEPVVRPSLTPRETEIVTRVAAGLANKEIAYELGISPNTVGTTLVSARKKLGVTSRVKLVEAVRRLARSE